MFLTRLVSFSPLFPFNVSTSIKKTVLHQSKSIIALCQSLYRVQEVRLGVS